MKKTEKLIDAMAEVDEDLLSAHVQVKKPTKTQKIRKYAGAAAIYVAACLVVALLLPFIIGNEENPESQPGEKPIVTETHSPVTDDPEAKKINVADIYKTYCDVTAEMMEQSVTIDEVNNIITAVEKAYAEYDFIIMRNESIMETTPKKSDVKFSDLKETGEDDSMIEQYHKYHANVLEIIWDALEARLPEGEGDYYNDFMDDAESDDLVRFDITDDIAEGGKASIAIDYPQGLRALVYHPYDKDGKIQDSDNMTLSLV